MKIIALYPVNVLVREIMSKPMITIFSNGSLKAALQTMQSKNIRRLPVVQKGDGRLLGIITDKDIFRAIMNNHYFFLKPINILWLQYRIKNFLV